MASIFTQRNFRIAFKDLAQTLTAHSEETKHIVELLRYISESLVWSEQHNEFFFEICIVEDFLSIFKSLLDECNEKQIVIQLIQTANILSHNLSKNEHKVYLLSSEFYSNIVSHPFDFSDEEIVENYTSLLKGLVTNTSSEILLFFVQNNNFSLYARSLIFINHPDNLVKTAARTVILILLKCKGYIVKDERTNRYILESGFIFKIIGVLNLQLSVLDQIIKTGNKDKKLEIKVNECVDTVYYINDMIEVDPLFTDNICSAFVSVLGPVLIGSINSDIHSSCHVSIHLTFYMLTQIFNIFKHTLITDTFANCLLSPEIPAILHFICNNPPLPSPPQLFPLSDSPRLKNPIRLSLISFLKCKEDDLVLLSLHVVQEILTNQGVTRATLLRTGLANSKELHEFNSSSGQANREILEALLSIYETYPLFKFAVYQILSRIMFDVLSSLSVSPEYECNAKKICCLNIERLKRLLGSQELGESVLDYFDQEWEYIKKLDLSSKVNLQNHIILPVFFGEAQLTGDYKKPSSDIELCKTLTKLFLLMRKLILSTDKFEVKDPNQYPFAYASKMTHWETGKCYTTSEVKFNRVYLVGENYEYSVKYLADDEDFFAIVTPDLYKLDFASVNVIKKWRYVSSSSNESNLQIKLTVRGEKPSSYLLGFDRSEDFYKEHVNITSRTHCSRSLELAMVESLLLETLNTFNKCL